MAEEASDGLEALRVLLEEGVEFILVGGLACVAQGAPFVTQDVDIVHARNSDNVERIMRALDRLDARYRGRPGPPLRPERWVLEGPGRQLLMTNAGPLDLLGAIEHGASFEALIDDVVDLDVGLSAPIHVLGIRRILELKRDSRHPRDRRTIAALESILAAADDA